MVLIAPFLLRKGFNGVTLFPFIILRHSYLKDNKILMNHEKIHLRQQLELLIIIFYLWYGLEYLVHWIRYKDKVKAYYAISFEKEAYANQDDFGYLKNRKIWSFLQYS